MNRQLKEDHGTVQDVPGRNTGSKAPNLLGIGGLFAASACLPLRTGLLQYKDQLPINEPVGWWILEAKHYSLDDLRMVVKPKVMRVRNQLQKVCTSQDGSTF
ncbi:hypothetical protein NQZ68_007124 [Dissostichus eleginoides]|nr:hypothetical protein NQZ68_007124 [Dissostichus eleginoides]